MTAVYSSVGSISKVAIALCPWVSAVWLWPVLAFAQSVTFDGTLESFGGAPQGAVPQSGGNYLVLEDAGLSIGPNLLHSFGQFSLGVGESIDFVSTNPDVRNIVTRVTGGSLSAFSGAIRADTNLYVINPSGIVFNEGAAIDVNGAFAASTANGVLFNSGGQFNANLLSPSDETLLTIVGDPSGFSYSQASPAPIQVNQLLGRPSQPILLAGGDVSVGGLLRSRGGLVEITGLSAPGIVEILRAPSLAGTLLEIEIDVVDDAPRANFLLDGGTIDVSTDNAALTFDGGSIGIKMNLIDLLNGSAVCGGIGAAEDCGGFPAGVNGGEAGNILLDASEHLRILDGSVVVNRIELGSSGNPSNIFDAIPDSLFGSVIVNAGSLEIAGSNSLVSATSRGNSGSAGLVLITVEGTAAISGDGGLSPIGVFSQVAPGTVGDAGGILIQADAIDIFDGALVTSRNSGVGDAGAIRLEAEQITVSGSEVISTIGIDLPGTQIAGFGNAGNVVFEGETVRFIEGAEISTSIENSIGAGNAGFVQVTATDFLVSESQVSSAIRPNGIGEAGNILVEADTARFTNGAEVSTNLEGQSQGNNLFAGNLIGALLSGDFNDVLASILIFSDSIVVEEGASLAASTTGQGNSGAIFLSATNDILLRNEGAIASEVGNGINATGGGIFLFSETLGLANRSEISVENNGTGSAGVILAGAQAIALAGESSISAETASGLGGIIIMSGDFLVLTNNSNIRTDARGVGDGGDIQLNITNTIYASPTSDNNITASATGTGGNIVFPASLLLRNIAPRSADFPDSNDITASGGFSNGTVSFQSGTQDLNPVQEQVNLPTNLVDPSRLIAQGCAAGNLTAAQEIGELVVTGRGGLPPAPSEQVGDFGTAPELISLPDAEATVPLEHLPGGLADIASPTELDENRVEAQGWRYGEEGEVILTASARGGAPVQREWLIPGCRDGF